MNKKQTIRLNESQLRRIVKESVKRVLKEDSHSLGDYFEMIGFICNCAISAAFNTDRPRQYWDNSKYCQAIEEAAAIGYRVGRDGQQYLSKIMQKYPDKDLYDGPIELDPSDARIGNDFGERD